MGDATKVEMGVCNITYNAVDLGYTKGGVKISYSCDTVEKTVDQEDAPIGEIVTKQKFEVKVPLAEWDLAKLDTLLPTSTYTTGTGKSKLVISGAAGDDLTTTAQELIITPVGGGENDKIHVHHAVARPNLEFAFEKDNVRVYEITFVALKGEDGFVTFGDPTASAT